MPTSQSHTKWLPWALALAGAHVVLGLTSWHDIGSNAAVGCINVFALWQGFETHWRRGRRQTIWYVAGYAALFVVFVAIGHSPLLFAGFGMLFAGCFRVPLLLGFLLITAFSVAFLTPYYIQATVLISIPYALVARMASRRLARFHLACFVFGFLLIVAITMPLLYLCLQITPQTLVVSFRDTAFRGALLTSAWTATAATAIVLIFGVPLAYALARLEFRGKDLLNSLIDLPIVIPQSVAGIALLVLLGPKTPIGQSLHAFCGIDVAGSYLGIIVCQVFVGTPFLVRSAATAFRDMGPSLENVSRTLGASPLNTFFRVSLPMASGAIFTGCLLTWARAVSEVGSLMVLAYHPFTVSIYTYDMFVQYGLKEAQPAAVLLVIVCLWGFLVLRWLRGVSLGPILGGGRRDTP